MLWTAELCWKFFTTPEDGFDIWYEDNTGETFWCALYPVYKKANTPIGHMFDCALRVLHNTWLTQICVLFVDPFVDTGK